MERIFPALESQGISIPLENQLDVYVIALGKAADRKAFQILLNLRLEGIKAEGLSETQLKGSAENGAST